MIEPDTDSKAETRTRLLEAAGEVFAEMGFARATIRDICHRAGANLAAVNYHFRDKEGLYFAVAKYAESFADQDFANGPGNQPGNGPGVASGATPEQQLRFFIRTFLFRAIGKDRLAWHGKMMAREMSEPTAMLDRLVAEGIRPRATVLEGIIRQLLGSAATKWRVEACARSVVSQCIFYHLCRPVIDRLHPNQRYDTESVEQLADHIAQFSLGAIQGIVAHKGF